jgi:MoxR-like ATPase
MTNLLLADEINRTSSKTQSALLEAMEERRVTVDGVTYPLPQPFFVLATQNPAGSAGTQMLPNSQLDRFLIKISMGYPDFQSQVNILRERHTSDPLDSVSPVLTIPELNDMMREAAAVETADRIYEYVTLLAQKTREHPAVELGISPRGALAVCRMAKARAYLSDREYVIPEDVEAVFTDVCAHRLMLNAKARMMETDAARVIAGILADTPLPTLNGARL